jgi:hypothetical protein
MDGIVVIVIADVIEAKTGYYTNWNHKYVDMRVFLCSNDY